MTIKSQLYLASTSPRRSELLQQLKLNFELATNHVDETRINNEAPIDYVQRLAISKAKVAINQLNNPQAVVIGADTIVVCQKQILGKPKDQADAVKMLKLLSGKVHQVHTAVAVGTTVKQKCILSTSQVKFKRICLDEINAYYKTGEPADKAGAYAIQGLAAIFVEYLAGSFSGVMGLPLFETAELLSEFGIKVMS